MANYSLQKLLQEHLPSFVQRHKLPIYQHRALQKVLCCRTAELGGHVQRCAAGHLNGVWYNSCKNRTCPQCHSLPAEQWLRNTQSTLIDCSHHHIVFTLPSELHVLWQYNRALLSDILFFSVSETLKTFANDQRYLGAAPGILLAQHTWGRDLSLHPHIHALVSHGGLNNQGAWITPRKKTLFPYKPVRLVYQGKFLAALKQALKTQKLNFPPDKDATHILNLINCLGRRYWHVYFAERYDHARGVAKYLSRYVKGGPLRRDQLTRAGPEKVTLNYHSHSSGKREALTLNIDDFIQRWLQHVPLPGKPTVRYGGLYSSACRQALNIAREKHGQRAVTEREVLTWQAYMSGRDEMPVCSRCAQPLVRAEKLPRYRIA